MPVERSQWADEKNEVICLVIMFILRVIAIKMSKMAYFLYSADGSQKSVTV